MAISPLVPSPRIRSFDGLYDPLETFRRLRSEGIIGDFSYLHLAANRAEIGWSPLSYLRLLSGERCDQWRLKLLEVAHSAELLGHKAVGYIGFDAVDGNVGTLPDGSGTGRPLIEFIIPGEVLTFSGSLVTHRTRGNIDLDRYLETRKPYPSNLDCVEPIRPISETQESFFLQSVQKAIAILSAGDIQKLVLSRYEAYEADFDPIVLLAALGQSENDTFLLCFGDLVAIVPSPELLLSARAKQIVTNPLAGTRPRGETPEEDDRLRNELRGNHKEIVEHVLAVTTMLSELDSVCEQNALVLNRFMDIAAHRRVQHLSSVITGTLRPECEVLDALWALFPSVTVTGIPKHTALKLLRDLEPDRRCLYSGVVGWMCGSGDCRFSLAIRSVFQYGTRSFLQAGAGIMAESVAEAELLEISYKLNGMREALARSTR